MAYTAEGIKRRPDYTMWAGEGDLPECPTVTHYPESPPTLNGMSAMLRELDVDGYVAVKVPEVHRRAVLMRVNTSGTRVASSVPGTKFTVSTEWFGVVIRRTA